MRSAIAQSRPARRKPVCKLVSAFLSPALALLVTRLLVGVEQPPWTPQAACRAGGLW